MYVVPAFAILALIPRGALDGSRRWGRWSRGRTGVGKAGAADPAPVRDVAVGAPRCAVAVAVVGAARCLAGDEVTGARAQVRGWESEHVDYGGCGEE